MSTVLVSRPPPTLTDNTAFIGSVSGRTGTFTATILDGDQNNSGVNDAGDSCHVVEGASNAKQ